MRVSSEIPASEFFEAFKVSHLPSLLVIDPLQHTRKSNRLDLNSGYHSYYSTSGITEAAVIYPSHSRGTYAGTGTGAISKTGDQDSEELNGLILKRQQLPYSLSRGAGAEDRAGTRQETAAAAAQADHEPISYSKLWHIVIGEWKGISISSLLFDLISPCLSICLFVCLSFCSPRSTEVQEDHHQHRAFELSGSSLSLSRCPDLFYF
jgi:hypothetical protein